ncbi:MAG: hypothetical protein LBP34_00215 [Flavobacteriaceae bacterium]|jgi:hypothetical protein|nr:hypothetical protein [Flavobacteriaceae bacterium]
MKKLFLLPVLMLSLTLSAQGSLKGGIHAGLPTGELADISSFNFGLDVAYLWEIEAVSGLRVGVATGYDHFIGKDYEKNNPLYNPFFQDLLPKTIKIEVKDFGFIPLLATGEYDFTSKVFVGLDLGFAIGTGKDQDSGFLFQPKVGLNLLEKYQLYLSYKSISSTYATSTFGIGGFYKF